MQHTYNYASKLDLKLVVCGLHARRGRSNRDITGENDTTQGHIHMEGAGTLTRKHQWLKLVEVNHDEHPLPGRFIGHKILKSSCNHWAACLNLKLATRTERLLA
jgi:hypothetical protein